MESKRVGWKMLLRNGHAAVYSKIESGSISLGAELQWAYDLNMSEPGNWIAFCFADWLKGQFYRNHGSCMFFRPIVKPEMLP